MEKKIDYRELSQEERKKIVFDRMKEKRERYVRMAMAKKAERKK